jgi:hypothetical protein
MKKLGENAVSHRKDAKVTGEGFFCLAACLREAASAKAGDRPPNKKHLR